MNTNLWDYYVQRAAAISDGAFQTIRTRADWEREAPLLRRQYLASMGLDPMPERCDLRLRSVRTLARPGARIETLAYQMLPDCWASAALFRPDPAPAGRLPAVLIACGHSTIGVLGAQGLALQWARRGYVCLVFDTVEQHDNPGDHHGLTLGRRPDWVSLGYTAAGGELWNSIRALDVLCGLPDVNPQAIGVTGASGGGAHSFFLAVADARIAALGSCCGVTLPKHTLDRQHLMTHCDCMYVHNLFQRDTAEFGALIAPRPALFCYGQRDYLFSRDEYTTLVAGMQRVYRLLGREADCQLFEFDGPHGYRPECVTAVSQWFDRHLAGGPRPAPAPAAAVPELADAELTVFNGTPPDPDRLDLLPELLSPRGSVALPRDAADAARLRGEICRRLADTVFHGIAERPAARFEQLGDWTKGRAAYRKYRAQSGSNAWWMETYVPPEDSGWLCVGLADEDETARSLWVRLSEQVPGHALAVIVPRFAGFNYTPTQRLNLRRAGCLVGLTPTALMVEDLRACLPALRALPECRGRRVLLAGRGIAGVAALYYALFDAAVDGLVLEALPASHRKDAFLLGVLRILDLPQAVGLMAPRPVGIVGGAPSLWTCRAYDRLGVGDRLVAGLSVGAVFDQVAAAAGPEA